MKPISKEVTAMVIESGKLTRHSIGTIDHVKLEITHNGKTLKLTKDEIMQKIFTEKNWFGDAKRYYVFCKLIDSGTLELIGLEEFNPYRAISAEEADIMVHEGVTMRGVRNLITRATGKGGSNKLLVFIIILVVIVTVAYMKAQGMF